MLCYVFFCDFPKVRNFPKIFLRSYQNVRPNSHLLSDVHVEQLAAMNAASVDDDDIVNVSHDDDDDAVANDSDFYMDSPASPRHVKEKVPA